jgi:hypothetical protein
VFYQGKFLTENIIHIIISQTSRMSNVLYNQYNRRLVYQITLHIESTVAKIELIIFSVFTYFSSVSIQNYSIYINVIVSL